MRGEMTFTNYLERIRSLVTFQFEQSGVFDKYLQLMAVETTELQNVFKDLLELRSIDTAEGKQLDIIGKIVGQERTLIDVNLLEFFGFKGTPPIVIPEKPSGYKLFGFEGHIYAGSFGTQLDPTIGARFRNPYEDDQYVNNDYPPPEDSPILSEDEYQELFIRSGSFGTELDPNVGAIFRSIGDRDTGNIVLSDSMYRVFIKAKIAKNVTRATPEDVMHFTNFIFNTSGSSVEDEGGAMFRIDVGRELSPDEVGLIKYVNRTANYESGLFPKPIGVGIRFSSFDYESFFAFAGVPNAKGFGEFEYDMFDGSSVYDGSILPMYRDTTVGGKLSTLHGEIL